MTRANDDALDIGDEAVGQRRDGRGGHSNSLARLGWLIAGKR
jgi:hypothetical protein